MNEYTEDAEEIVITVYGGDDKRSEKILARTEVLVALDNTESSDIRWIYASEKELTLTIDYEIWVTRVTATVPKQFRKIGFTPEQDLAINGLPYRVEPDCTLTINFPRTLLHLMRIH